MMPVVKSGLFAVVLLLGTALAGCGGSGDNDIRPGVDIPVPKWKPGYWWEYDFVLDPYGEKIQYKVNITVLNTTLYNLNGAAVYVVRQDLLYSPGVVNSSRLLAVRQSDLMNLGEVTGLVPCQGQGCTSTVQTNETRFSGGDPIVWKTDARTPRDSRGHNWDPVGRKGPSGWYWFSTGPGVCPTTHNLQECYGFGGYSPDLDPSLRHGYRSEVSYEFVYLPARGSIVDGDFGVSREYDLEHGVARFAFSWLVADDALPPGEENFYSKFALAEWQLPIAVGETDLTNHVSSMPND